MDFTIPERARAAVELVREFVNREVIPLEPLFPKQSVREILPLLNEERARARESEFPFRLVRRSR